MKRVLVLTLGLTLIVGVLVGTASAQHISGDPAVDASWEWPEHCRKSLPDRASDVAKQRTALRLCRPSQPPLPCPPVYCDPPPDPCRVMDELGLPCPVPFPCPIPTVDEVGQSDVNRLTWWPCPPPRPCLAPDEGRVTIAGEVYYIWPCRPPCPDLVNTEAELFKWPCPIPPPSPCPVPSDRVADQADSDLVYWPCPIPPSPPCEFTGFGSDGLSWAPCPVPPPPCEFTASGLDALTWAPCPIPPIPPEPCELLDARASSPDEWRCPDHPAPVPIEPQPLPLPLPLEDDSKL